MKNYIELEILCSKEEDFERNKELEKTGIEVEEITEENGEWVKACINVDCFYPTIDYKRTIVFSGGTSFTCILTYNELKEKLNIK